MQRQFLPFDDDSQDVEEMEFNLDSMTALDYLRQVRFQRKNLPNVVVVHPFRESEDIQAGEETPKESQDLQNPKYPTKEWQQIQSEKFTDIQKKIAELRKDQKILDQRVSQNPELDISEEESCVEFCQSNEPVLSRILSFNQGQLEEILEHLSNHLSENILTTDVQNSNQSWLTKWFYALFSCLRLPLDPEVHNTLRMIAKSCIRINERIKSLSEPSSNDLSLPWNLIIVIIAISFKQFDLLSL